MRSLGFLTFSLVITYILLAVLSLSNQVSSQGIERDLESYEGDPYIYKRSSRLSEEELVRMLWQLHKMAGGRQLSSGTKRIGSEFIGKRYIRPEDKRLGSEFLGKRTIGSEFLGKRGIGSEFLGKRSQEN